MHFLQLIIGLVLVFPSFSEAQDTGWSHLELGAANYGAKPPKSRERGLQGPLHEDQYRVLFETADTLIKERGPKGVFYVNDLVPADAHFAAEKLRGYLTARGDSQVQVQELAGDMTKLAFPKVQSAHLKNPEKQLFYLDGIGQSLQRIADRSETGLRIQTYYETQMLDKLNPKDVRISGRLGNGGVYYWPNGKVVVEKNGKLKGQPRIPGLFVVTPSACGVASGLSNLKP